MDTRVLSGRPSQPPHGRRRNCIPQLDAAKFIGVPQPRHRSRSAPRIRARTGLVPIPFAASPPFQNGRGESHQTRFPHSGRRRRPAPKDRPPRAPLNEPRSTGLASRPFRRGVNHPRNANRRRPSLRSKSAAVRRPACFMHPAPPECRLRDATALPHTPPSPTRRPRGASVPLSTWATLPDFSVFLPRRHLPDRRQAPANRPAPEVLPALVMPYKIEVTWLAGVIPRANRRTSPPPGGPQFRPFARQRATGHFWRQNTEAPP